MSIWAYFSNVGAACEFTAGPDVLKVEEATVLVALVSKSKKNAGAVFGGSYMRSVMMRGM